MSAGERTEMGPYAVDLEHGLFWDKVTLWRSRRFVGDKLLWRGRGRSYYDRLVEIVNGIYRDALRERDRSTMPELFDAVYDLPLDLPPFRNRLRRLPDS